MYVAAGDYREAASILLLNLELCAFLQIEPVLDEQSPTEPDMCIVLRHLLALQKELRVRNRHFPVQGPLHLLASQGSFSSQID